MDTANLFNSENKSEKHVIAHLQQYKINATGDREAASIALDRYVSLLSRFPEFASFQRNVNDPLLGRKGINVRDYVNYYYVKLTGTDPQGIISNEAYERIKALEDRREEFLRKEEEYATEQARIKAQNAAIEKRLAEIETQMRTFEKVADDKIESGEEYLVFYGFSDTLWKLAEKMTHSKTYLGSIPSLSAYTGMDVAPSHSTSGIDSTALLLTLAVANSRTIDQILQDSSVNSSNFDVAALIEDKVLSGLKVLELMCSPKPIYSRCARVLGAEVYTADTFSQEKFEYLGEKFPQNLREEEIAHHLVLQTTSLFENAVSIQDVTLGNFDLVIRTHETLDGNLHRCNMLAYLLLKNGGLYLDHSTVPKSLKKIGTNELFEEIKFILAN